MRYEAILAGRWYVRDNVNPEHMIGWDRKRCGGTLSQAEAEAVQLDMNRNAHLVPSVGAKHPKKGAP